MKFPLKPCNSCSNLRLPKPRTQRGVGPRNRLKRQPEKGLRRRLGGREQRKKKLGEGLRKTWGGRPKRKPGRSLWWWWPREGAWSSLLKKIEEWKTQEEAVWRLAEVRGSGSWVHVQDKRKVPEKQVCRQCLHKSIECEWEEGGKGKSELCHDLLISVCSSLTFSPYSSLLYLLVLWAKYFAIHVGSWAQPSSISSLVPCSIISAFSKDPYDVFQVFLRSLKYVSKVGLHFTLPWLLQMQGQTFGVKGWCTLTIFSLCFIFWSNYTTPWPFPPQSVSFLFTGSIPVSGISSLHLHVYSPVQL